MNNKKGFTLIELLGVIVILSILLTVVTPTIINSIKSSRDNTNTLTEKLIYSAAREFVQDNLNDYPKINENKYCISVTDLADLEYIKGPLKINDQDITNTKSVEVTFHNNYEYKLVDSVACQEHIDSKQYYTVTYNANGGKVSVPSQSIEEQKVITEPPTPVRPSYIFEGWCKDSICSQMWNFETDAVQNDTTLYAKWKAEQYYTITYNANGGTTPTSTQSILEGNKIATPPTPTRTDYTFQGWYRDSACTQLWDFGFDKVNSNITLYAKWAGWSSWATSIPSGVTDTNYTIQSRTEYSSRTKTAVYTYYYYQDNWTGWTTGGQPSNTVSSQSRTVTLSYVFYRYISTNFKAFSYYSGYSNGNGTTSVYQEAHSTSIPGYTIVSGTSYRRYNLTGNISSCNSANTSYSCTKSPEYYYTGSGGPSANTQTQYNYLVRSYTSSGASSLSGWTRYNSAVTSYSYSGWSGWTPTYAAATSSLEVQTRTTYRYLLDAKSL